MIYCTDTYACIYCYISEYELELYYRFALTVKGQWEVKWCINSL